MTTAELRANGFRLYVLLVADLDPSQHVNAPGMIPPEEASADALAGLLRAEGVEADATGDGTAIGFWAANAVGASSVRFACVCWLAAASYRAEAASYARYALR